MYIETYKYMYVSNLTQYGVCILWAKSFNGFLWLVSICEM